MQMRPAVEAQDTKNYPSTSLLPLRGAGAPLREEEILIYPFSPARRAI